jgi:hypothetical protein
VVLQPPDGAKSTSLRAPVNTRGVGAPRVAHASEGLARARHENRQRGRRPAPSAPFPAVLMPCGSLTQVAFQLDVQSSIRGRIGGDFVAPSHRVMRVGHSRNDSPWCA